MEQSSAIVDALKRYVKSKGLNYKDIAKAMGLSEASVKRIFSEKSFSIQRLEKLCDFLEISILDLVRMSERSSESRKTVLSESQEKSLAKNPALLAYFYLIINSWTPKQIMSRYAVKEVEGIKLLTTLDKLRLIELLPGNRVKKLTSRFIDWKIDGPVRRLYETQAKVEFLKGRFASKGQNYQFVFGELSESSQNILIRKMDELVKDFNELVDIDMNLPEEQKKSVGLLLATRPWVFSVIEQFKR